jgi:hypothetical protein
MTSKVVTQRRTDPATWIRYGLLAGIVAGVVFALFEMVMAVILDGPEAFFMPLRMIGAIGLGPGALEPGTSLALAGGVGLVLHMVLSTVYGIVITALLSLVPRLAASRESILLTTSIAGFALWPVNFYGFAPVFGWNWFPEGTNPVVQIVAHTFFYGTVLGLALNEASFKRRD